MKMPETHCKILHISDQPFGYKEKTCISGQPDKLIEKIKNEFSEKVLFLINVNYSSENIARADNAGILFLKYLRLNHFNQHCILYSFLSREQLMLQDPHNAIIFSEGVTFIRMPEDLDKLPFEDLKKRKAPDDLSDYFKAEFRLPDDRHFFANWWGVLQLWKIQMSVERLAGKTKIEEIELGFKGSLHEKNSYMGLVAQYVKGIHDNNIENKLRSLITSKEENYKTESRNRNQIREEINNLFAEDYILEIQLDTLEEVNKEKKENVLSKLIAVFNNLPSSVQIKINSINEKRVAINKKIVADKEYLELLDLIEIEKDYIYEERRKLNRQIQSKIDAYISSNSFLNENYSLDNIRHKLSEKKPSILIVDDQANDGWASIFQRMIYGGNDEAFTVLQPKKEDSVESIINSIGVITNSKKIDLLILDLRLKGETGSNLKINEISGICVLEALNTRNIQCPILITSASNKIWSYRESMKLGADAYWIKEGLDDNFGLDASIENYLRLIDLIYSLCFNKEFRFLYDKLLPVFSKLKNANTLFWWETKFWEKDTFTFKRAESTISVIKLKPVDREEIIDALNAGFDLFKKYLSEKIQKYETINTSKYVGSLVIVQFSRVLEIIHRFDENNERISLSEKMQTQLDEQTFNFYSKLITIRNSATHSFSADFNTIRQFVDLFISYLTSNILDKPIDEFVRHENTQTEPENDKWYSSEIESKHRDYPTYYLKNPNLSLQSGRTKIVLDIRFNQHLISNELRMGDKIEFQLDIKEKNGTLCYYAANARIV